MVTSDGKPSEQFTRNSWQKSGSPAKIFNVTTSESHAPPSLADVIKFPSTGGLATARESAAAVSVAAVERAVVAPPAAVPPSGTPAPASLSPRWTS